MSSSSPLAVPPARTEGTTRRRRRPDAAWETLTVGLKNNERFASAPSLHAVEATVARESHVLTKAQRAALEKAQVEKEVYDECGSACPGYGGTQDTLYVGTLKGVGRIYQQTFIDTYSKVAVAALYEHKTSLTAADRLNDQMAPFFEGPEAPLSRILTDRGTAYCGSPDRPAYERYVAIENIDHTRTKVKSPHANGIVERFSSPEALCHTGGVASRRRGVGARGQ